MYVRISGLPRGWRWCDSITGLSMFQSLPSGAVYRFTDARSGKDWKPYSLMKREMLSPYASYGFSACHTPQKCMSPQFFLLGGTLSSFALGELRV